MINTPCPVSLCRALSGALNVQLYYLFLGFPIQKILYLLHSSRHMCSVCGFETRRCTHAWGCAAEIKFSIWETQEIDNTIADIVYLRVLGKATRPAPLHTCLGLCSRIRFSVWETQEIDNTISHLVHLRVLGQATRPAPLHTCLGLCSRITFFYIVVYTREGSSNNIFYIVNAENRWKIFRIIPYTGTDLFDCFI